MTSFKHLRTQTIVVLREATTGVGNRIAMTTVTSSLLVHIQPLSDQKSNISQGKFGKRMRLYADGSADIQEGDRLRETSTNDEFNVVSGGVSRRNFSNFDFLEIVLEQTKT